MNENWAQDEIDMSYEQIISKLKGGTLYGVPFNDTDIKWMVVSAYDLGKYELRVQHMDERSMLEQIAKKIRGEK